MSFTYHPSGYPLSSRDCDALLGVLRELFPSVVGSMDLVSCAFHVGVLDGAELELLYEYLETGKTYWSQQPLGSTIVYKK